MSAYLPSAYRKTENKFCRLRRCLIFRIVSCPPSPLQFMVTMISGWPSLSLYSVAVPSSPQMLIGFVATLTFYFWVIFVSVFSFHPLIVFCWIR